MTDIDGYTKSMLTRTGTDRLPAHLEAEYGIAVSGCAQLDLGVFRVSRSDGPDWVARVFPVGRPASMVAGDAAILDVMAEIGFPAERLAAPSPVSELDQQAVLVTEFVVGVPRGERVAAIRRLGGFVRLGAMLGRLHTGAGAGAGAGSGSGAGSGTVARPGGAWHHLADGAPSAEIAAVAELLDSVAAGRDRTAYESLRAAVAEFDSGDGLPEALLHPDFVLANAVVTEEKLVMVDWSGAGWGPRVWPLAYLLFSAGARGMERVRSVVLGYTRSVRPEPEELSRLAAVMRVRPSVLEVWAFCVGRKSAAEAARGLAEIRELADAVAARARTEFTTAQT
jgi:Ser/Thr protein kinase RdoA (MazF antagonist)